MVRVFFFSLLIGASAIANAAALLCHQVYNLGVLGSGLYIRATHWNVFQMKDGNEVGLVIFNRKSYNMPEPESALVGSFYIRNRPATAEELVIPAQKVRPVKVESDGEGGVRMVFMGRADSTAENKRHKITVKIAAPELEKEHPSPREIIFEIESIANGSSKVNSSETIFRYQATDIKSYHQSNSIGPSQLQLSEMVAASEVKSSTKQTTEEIDSTVLAMASEGKLERSFWDVYQKLSQEPPSAFDHFHTAHKRNLLEHAEKHRREFGAGGWMTYEKLASAFARDRHPMDLYAVSQEQVVKFNMVSGNFLILNRHTGNFITFFNLKADSAGERLLMFLSKIASDRQRPGKQLL